MANYQKKIYYVTEEQYLTLYNDGAKNGKITINDVEYYYDEDATYYVKEDSINILKQTLYGDLIFTNGTASGFSVTNGSKDIELEFVNYSDDYNNFNEEVNDSGNFKDAMLLEIEVQSTDNEVVKLLAPISELRSTYSVKIHIKNNMILVYQDGSLKYKKALGEVGEKISFILLLDSSAQELGYGTATYHVIYKANGGI